MRFKSAKTDGFQIFAVAGTNTVSFGIEASAAARKGLLGFAVERAEPKENERYFMPGFKVFRSIIPHPDEKTRPSTHDHPVQSLVWDDFTGKDGRQYDYFFHPLRGTPRNLDRSARAIKISVQTEPLFSKSTHDVFFNRGVASSQAYADQFDNLPPDKIKPPAKRQRALDWLSRKLDDALLMFIKNAKKNDGLLCCFYEFRYQPVADEIAAAIKRGVKVQLIIDAKKNESTDKKGVFHPSFPRVENLKTIKAAKIPKANVIYREARKNDIQHNKFMVLLKGTKRVPSEVWTGSTNISDGGIHGQTNVGHWVRDAKTAGRYQAYWKLLSGDPGARDGTTAAGKKQNAAFTAEVEKITPAVLTLKAIPAGITALFSPRKGLKVLGLYVALVAEAQRSGFITLAFGINKDFKEALKGHTAKGPITFMMLEKKDAPTKKNKDTFVAINAKQNVYKAWGSFIQDPLYQWTKETNAQKLQLNQHVSYIHSKFLMRDPLGDDPLVVTGSANFSAPSTNANDENMLVIRGDRRVADIYFTEFNRLFNHYYFRSVMEATKNSADNDTDGNLFLKEKAEQWLENYKPGKLRQKRVDLFVTMSGFK